MSGEYPAAPRRTIPAPAGWHLLTCGDEVLRSEGEPDEEAVSERPVLWWEDDSELGLCAVTVEGAVNRELVGNSSDGLAKPGMRPLLTALRDPAGRLWITLDGCADRLENVGHFRRLACGLYRKADARMAARIAESVGGTPWPR